MSDNEEKAADAARAQALLHQFLDAVVPGDGDSPEIAEAELLSALDLFYLICDAKWGRDADGNSPIRMHLWNRSYERLALDGVFLHNPVGNEDLAEQEARNMRNLRVLTSGIAALGDELTRTARALDELRSLRLRKSAAFEVHQLVFKGNAAWAASDAGQQAPISVHLTRAEAESFCAEQMTLGFELLRHELTKAEPGPREDPADNFRAYRDKVKALSGKLLPAFTARRDMNLTFIRTL